MSASVAWWLPGVVIGVVHSVQDAEKFSQALGLECLDSFLVVRQQSLCLTSVEQDGDNHVSHP